VSKKLFVIGFLLSFLNLQAQQAYYRFNQNCEHAYNQLMQLDFDSAYYFIQHEKTVHPQNLIPVLLDNYMDFLQIVLFENESLFDQKEDYKKDRLDLWKTGPKDNPWFLSGQAQIKLQWAFSRVLFDEYFTAATEINSAYHMLEKNAKHYPDFLADNMGIGILHTMIDLVPEQYQWAMKLFGFYGTIEQGMEEINDQILKSNYTFRYEALFYFTFLKLNLQRDTQRFEELLNYYEKPEFKAVIERSPLLSFGKAVLFSRYNNDVAIAHLKADYGLYQKSEFYYPVFLLGEALLYRMDKECIKHIEDYINNYQGKNFKKTALQRLAWWHYVHDEQDNYLQLMNRIDKEGANLLDSDKSALKESKLASEGILPNKTLLKARLFFDGHYFSLALDEIKSLDLSELDKEEKLEYYYRKGRIYHEMGQMERAVSAYQTATEEGAKSQRYFAAKAALKTGEIKEQKGAISEAQEAYKMCLELDFTEYRKGIRAKAKAGLQRLSENN
jgi:hypothetical protein